MTRYVFERGWGDGCSTLCIKIYGMGHSREARALGGGGGSARK